MEFPSPSSSSSPSLTPKKQPQLLSTCKRTPQRGLGVARLEHLRLQEERQLFLHQQQEHPHSSFQRPRNLSHSPSAPTIHNSTGAINTTICRSFCCSHQPSHDICLLPQYCTPHGFIAPSPPPQLRLFLPINAFAQCTELPDMSVVSLPHTQLESPHALQDSVLSLDCLHVETTCLTKRLSSRESCEFCSQVVTATDTPAGRRTHGVSGAISAGACWLELGLSTKSGTNGRNLEPATASQGTASRIAADSIVRKITNRDQTRHAVSLWGPLSALSDEKEIKLQGMLTGRCTSVIRSPDLVVQPGPLNTISKEEPPQIISFRKHPAWFFTQEPTIPWKHMDLNVSVGENEFLSDQRSSYMSALVVPSDHASLTLSSCASLTSAKVDSPVDETRSRQETRSLLSLSMLDPEIHSMSENLSLSSIFDLADASVVSSYTRDHKLKFGQKNRCPSKTPLSNNFLRLGLPTTSELNLETCDKGVNYINGSYALESGEETSRKRYRPPQTSSRLDQVAGPPQCIVQSGACIRGQHDKQRRSDHLRRAIITEDCVIDLDLRLSLPQFIA